MGVDRSTPSRVQFAIDVRFWTQAESTNGVVSGHSGIPTLLQPTWHRAVRERRRSDRQECAPNISGASRFEGLALLRQALSSAIASAQSAGGAIVDNPMRDVLRGDISCPPERLAWRTSSRWASREPSRGNEVTAWHRSTGKRQAVPWRTPMEWSSAAPPHCSLARWSGGGAGRSRARKFAFVKPAAEITAFDDAEMRCPL